MRAHAGTGDHNSHAASVNCDLCDDHAKGNGSARKNAPGSLVPSAFDQRVGVVISCCCRGVGTPACPSRRRAAARSSRDRAVYRRSEAEPSGSPNREPALDASAAEPSLPPRVRRAACPAPRWEVHGGPFRGLGAASRAVRGPWRGPWRRDRATSTASAASSWVPCGSPGRSGAALLRGSRSRSR